jgi:carboxylesterase
LALQIIPTAEPFIFPGNSTGCLLVHGFTGTPKEMRTLGEHLASQGYTVLGIRLAGHATRITDMMRTRWWDWVASVEDGYNLLKPISKRIIVIGLSMGGILSLHAAARFKVDGVITMSAPYSLPGDWRVPFLGLLSLVKPEISKGPSDWHDQKSPRTHVAYENYPTRCFRDLQALMQETHKNLPEVKCPALLMQSSADSTILPNSMKSYYDLLGTKNKEMIMLNNSGHIITYEPERDIVFDGCSKFVRQISQA